MFSRSDYSIDISNAIITVSKDDTTALYSTKGIAESFFSTRVKGSDIIPPVIRGFSEDYRFVMVERIPAYHKIEVSPPEVGTQEIAVPWTVWVFEFNAVKQIENLWVYATMEAVVTGEAILFDLPLPLVDEHNMVAEGFFPKKLSTFMSLADRLSGGIQRFWSTPFEVDEDHQEWFDRLSDVKDLNETLDLMYVPSNIPPILQEWNKDHARDDPYLLVDNWIEFFEDTRALKRTDTETPLLDFITEMIPANELNADGEHEA